MPERTVKDWETKLAELDRRLAEWYRRFDAEVARLARGARRLFRKPDPARLSQAETAARQSVGEELLREVAAFLDRLSADYLQALPGERARIRARIGSHEAIFRFHWSFCASQPDAIRGPDDTERLRLALAAVSIDDLRSTDVRAVDELLGRLWLAAERAGIEPAPVFAEVATVSNRATGGGGAHFRERLEGFERSVHFRDVVQPQRAKRDRRASKLAS
jgi:hypothetical protein